jgi:hypothetical protein
MRLLRTCAPPLSPRLLRARPTHTQTDRKFKYLQRGSSRRRVCSSFLRNGIQRVEICRGPPFFIIVCVHAAAAAACVHMG